MYIHNTTTSYNLNHPPSKKDIIQRLFQEGHIDFNEMWILLQDEPTVKYVPMPQQQGPPWEPFGPIHPYPWEQNPPYTYTVDPASKRCTQ